MVIFDNIKTIYTGTAGSWNQKCRQNLDCGSLPGTIGTEQTKNLAALNRKGNATIRMTSSAFLLIPHIPALK